jgi:uncharacterized membrane protein
MVGDIKKSGIRFVYMSSYVILMSGGRLFLITTPLFVKHYLVFHGVVKLLRRCYGYDKETLYGLV